MIISTEYMLNKSHDVGRAGWALYQGPWPPPPPRLQLGALKMKAQCGQPGALLCCLSDLLPSALCTNLVTGRATVSGRWVKVKLPQVQAGGVLAGSPSQVGRAWEWGKECRLEP